MTRAEELADKFGITEAHDQNCQEDSLCREHFIEKLEEAFRKCDSGEYRGAITLVSFGIPGGPPSGNVEVSLMQHEDQKPDPTDVLLFRRRKPDPAFDAMMRARKRARLNEGRV